MRSVKCGRQRQASKRRLMGYGLGLISRPRYPARTIRTYQMEAGVLLALCSQTACSIENDGYKSVLHKAKPNLCGCDCYNQQAAVAQTHDWLHAQTDCAHTIGCSSRRSTVQLLFNCEQQTAEFQAEQTAVIRGAKETKDCGVDIERKEKKS